MAWHVPAWTPISGHRFVTARTNQQRQLINMVSSAPGQGPIPPPSAKSLAGRLRAMALALPEASEDFPWGERAIKVRGKAFLFLRSDKSGASFSVKLPASAADALELPFAEPTHYGLGKYGWVTFTMRADEELPFTTFTGWLEESYRAVAPKTLGRIVGAAQEQGVKKVARTRKTARRK